MRHQFKTNGCTCEIFTDISHFRGMCFNSLNGKSKFVLQKWLKWLVTDSSRSPSVQVEEGLSSSEHRLQMSELELELERRTRFLDVRTFNGEKFEDASLSSSWMATELEETLSDIDRFEQFWSINLSKIGADLFDGERRCLRFAFKGFLGDKTSGFAFKRRSSIEISQWSSWPLSCGIQSKVYYNNWKLLLCWHEYVSKD